MSRLRSPFIFVAALLLLALPLTTTRATEPLIQGTLRIVDGDTFDLGGVRIRLHGVDAPERAQICRDRQGADWRCGDWAGRALRELTRDGALACRDLGERTYGRTVAACTLDGRDLAAQLIAAGVVRACPRYAARYPHSRGYPALEAAAMAQRLGLHAGETPPLAGFCGPAARA